MSPIKPNLFNDKTSSDFVLIFGEQKIYVHQETISIIPYFSRIFKDDPIVLATGEVILSPDIYHSARLIIKYAYGFKCFNHNYWLDTLVVAKLWSYEEFITNHLDQAIDSLVTSDYDRIFGAYCSPILDCLIKSQRFRDKSFYLIESETEPYASLLVTQPSYPLESLLELGNVRLIEKWSQAHQGDR